MSQPWWRFDNLREKGRRKLKYRYEALDSSNQEIRLIHILPAKSGNTSIRCEIKHISMNESFSYECLSYVWGSPEKPQPILLNGFKLTVTQNLEAALRRFQPKNGDEYDPNRWFWIDAMCINQRDNMEKSSQVQMMTQIYRQAGRVLVWLGPGDESSHQAIDLMDDLDAQLESVGAFPSQGHMDYERMSPIGKDFLAEMGTAGSKTDALLQFSRREWFGRAWVIQEVAVSRSALVVCGNQTIDFLKLFHMLQFLQYLALNYQRQIARAGKLFSKITGIAKRFTAVMSSYEDALLDRPGRLFLTLYTTHYHHVVEASRPEDYVYALFGIVPKERQLGIEIDYRKHWKFLYEELTLAFIRQHGLNVLCYCSWDDSVGRDTPASWAIDWRALFPEPDGQNVSGDTITSIYSVSGKTTQPVDDLQGPTPGTLRFQGFIVDEISTTGRAGHERLHRRKNKKYRDWIDDISAFTTSLAQTIPLSAEQQQEWLWKTVTADCILIGDGLESRRSEPSDAVAYRKLLDYMKPEASSEPGYDEKARITYSYRRSVGRAQDSRRPFMTKNARIGIGPNACQARDLICIVPGATVPFILRKNGNGMFRLVGTAYVHGIMDGELVENDPELESFTVY